LAPAPLRANIARVKERTRRIAIAVTAAWFGLAVCGDSAQADGLDRTAKFAPRFGEAAFDVVALRPLNAAALLVGSALFVASLPAVLPFAVYKVFKGSQIVEGVRPSWSTFVQPPLEQAVVRPLGDF